MLIILYTFRGFIYLNHGKDFHGGREGLLFRFTSCTWFSNTPLTFPNDRFWQGKNSTFA